MNRWRKALNDGAFSGGLASALSSLVLAWRGHIDLGAGAAPLNAPAHWLTRRALAREGSSLHYTPVGMVIHHLSSIFWAFFYELAASRCRRDSRAQAVRDAAAVAALAALVDYRVVPQRLTPGFEQRLTRRSLVWVYVAFAAGLVLGTRLNGAGAGSAAASPIDDAAADDAAADDAARAAAPAAPARRRLPRPLR